MDTVVAGAMAALAVDALIYPLDTVKTRLQAPDVATRFPNRRALFAGLYQGIGTVVIATLPAAGAFFTTYEGTKSSLSPVLSGSVLHMTSSSIAELVSCAVLTPAEIIKQRAQVANLTSKASTASGKAVLDGVKEAGRQAAQGKASLASAAAQQSGKQAVQKTLNETAAGQTAKATAQAVKGSDSGLAKTFVRGYFALAGRNLPFTALQFPLYEHFRAVLSKRWNVRTLSDTDTGEVIMHGTSKDGSTGRDQGHSSVSGRPRSAHEMIVKPGLVASSSAAMAGSIAALVSTPIDNAKTRIMINSPSSPDPSVQGGTIRTMFTIFQRDGWKALWRGGLLRSAWTALGAGVYLGSYESGRLWWRSRDQLAT